MLTEHQEQCNFVDYLDYQHPTLDYFSIPNGGLRNKIVAVKLKKEGVKAGIPDMFFPSLRLFIEFKRRKGGSLSEKQKYWISVLQKAGYRVEVCKGCDEAISLVKEVLKN